jgi:flavin-dependent dehydrogenase
MYDVIVVGARCAGAPTAMLLAQRGYRVLLVDRVTFPKDLVMSTHLIWQRGGAQLARWGLLEQVRASSCPPLATIHFDLGPFTLHGSPPPADGVTVAYAPRRVVLDQILVQAAVAAGAELREAFTVRELTWDDDRVVGLRGSTRGGVSVAERAQVVIGADGLHSRVARAVGASEYHGRPPLQGTYFAYWSNVTVNGIELTSRPYRFTYAWQTNNGLALVGVNWTARDFHNVHADIEGHYFRVLDEAASSLAERVRVGHRVGRWIGGSVPNFFRTSWGPGWALVGDAGYHKDPCTAQGISDAFHGAELLTEAIDAGLSGRRSLDEALADYERRRNDHVMPMYEFTCQLAPFDPPPPEMQQLFAALHGNQGATDQFLGVLAGHVPVGEFFGPENVGSITPRHEMGGV